MPGLLQSILFHCCMHMVLDPLHTPLILSQKSIVADPFGNLCQCLFFLMDLKEQWLIAGLSTSICPKCLAKTTDSKKPHACERQTGKSILRALKEIQACYPTADTWQFFLKAKELGLAGVEHVCWEGLKPNICDVLCVDVLHGIHKFFKDHVMEWLVCMVRENELD